MVNSISNHYGIYNRTIFNNYQETDIPAVSAVKKVNNEAVQETSASTQQFSKEMKSFLNDYRDQFYDLKNAAEQLTASSDMQTARSSVEHLVDTYNSTVQFVNENSTKSGRDLTQAQRLLPLDMSDESLESIGLTFAKDGTLNFQADIFDESYRQDEKRVQNLLGGTHSVADHLDITCERALAQPSSSFFRADQVEWDAKNLQQQQNYDKKTLSSGIYSRRGSYDMMNFAAMGVFLNTKV